MPPRGRRATAEPDQVEPDQVEQTGPEPDADVELGEDTEPDEVEPAAALPTISAGVQSDLDMRGWASDPATGGTFRRDKETGEITYTPRQ